MHLIWNSYLLQNHVHRSANVWTKNYRPMICQNRGRKSGTHGATWSTNCMFSVLLYSSELLFSKCVVAIVKSNVGGGHDILILRRFHHPGFG